jgi:hypothetical protein
MLRATRLFIADRQPHTDFVVGTVSVAAYEHPVRRWDIQDAVAAEVRRNGQWRACIGWRVHPYNALRDETLFEPWWWIIDDQGRAWDIDPPDSACEYVLDQALVIYRREAFEAHRPIRPPDLYLAGGRWVFRCGDQDHPLTRLDRENLTSRDRDRSVQVSILSTNI